MIEGLIILGIAAIVIVVALFGTTIISIGTSIVASISAMIMGAVTGTATLLTSWISWVLAADATTFYLGYIWFAGWIALFAYSAFKIATSDKKKWMNLVGRGSNYIGIILVLFLVAQPLIVSAGASYFADTTQLTEVDYNINLQNSNTQVGKSFSVYKTNATDTYWQDQTVNYDNTTKECIIASIDYDTVPSATAAGMIVYLNTSMIVGEQITRIVMSWFYVGTGNLTSLKLASTYPAPTKYYVESVATYNMLSNGSYTWNPEVFEANQLATKTEMVMYLICEDSANLPISTDYISVTIQFYTATTVLTQETLMFWLAISITAIDLVALLYVTGLGEKYIW